MRQKYKVGDKVEITFGHPLWTISGPNKGTVKDINSGLVGKKATIYEVSDNDDYRYALEIEGLGKSAWFSSDQLKIANK